MSDSDTQDDGPQLTADLSELSREDWMDALEDLAEDNGYFEPLGPNHSAVFIDRGDRLVVTFENVADVRKGENALPMGFELVNRGGWSNLVILAEGETFYRHDALYQHFDQLIDDGFFENFEEVVFYGAHMGAYGAAAFSVASPAATVLLISPIATIDPRVCEWDDRYADLRLLNFNDRYGYAPDMIEAAREVFVFYDPKVVLDAMHAALFTKPHVTKLRCSFMGHQLEDHLDLMDLRYAMIKLAIMGKFSARAWAKLYRVRRDYSHYLRSLMLRLDREDRPYFTSLLCRNVDQRLSRPRFRRRLDQLFREYPNLKRPDDE